MFLVKNILDIIQYLGLFKPLCDILNISINDLMSREKIKVENYNNKFEEDIVNTIDYIDKKNNKNRNFMSVSFIVSGLMFTIFSLISLADSAMKDFITVVGMMFAIMGINQLANKYSYLKRIVLLFIMALCILSIALTYL